MTFFFFPYFKGAKRRNGATNGKAKGGREKGGSGKGWKKETINMDKTEDKLGKQRATHTLRSHSRFLTNQTTDNRLTSNIERLIGLLNRC